MFTIYCHTNRANQKRYVGLTKRSVATRWKQHVKDSVRGTQWLFHRAIRAHGPDSFASETLEVVDTLDAANEAERWWIAHFGSDDSALGYNLDAGGTARNTHESTRRKISENVSRQMAARTDEEKERLAQEHSDFMKARAAAMSDAERKALMAPAMTCASRAARGKSLKEMWASKSPEERRAAMAHARAFRTPENYRAGAAKQLTTVTTEQRVTRARDGWKTRRENAAKNGGKSK